ncbi:uncharacterized protein LOC110012824 [Sesamum indicum]|uniref:Uncharacterized protein LOC110012824 n=1 Tax=Sesamum indicum TaxID=4182 RepID=A0A8M8VAX6_SESIN|nr:uncharacterized protein LOC110012824 [Sesamum indicum]
MATTKEWPLQDVNNAFVHGFLEEDLYMTPLEGYHVAPGLHAPLGPLVLLVYVDDILVTGPSLPDIQFVKDYLHVLFTIKDIGDAQYFLGLEIARSSTRLYVSQTKYIADIIKDSGLGNAKSASTPLPRGLKLTPTSGDLLSNPSSYKSLLCTLLQIRCSRSEQSILELIATSYGTPTRKVSLSLFMFVALCRLLICSLSNKIQQIYEAHTNSMAFSAYCVLRTPSFDTFNNAHILNGQKPMEHRKDVKPAEDSPKHGAISTELSEHQVGGT